MRTIAISYDQIMKDLARGSSVALMIRHAERPHIDRSDPTFGETLPLTPDGEAAAISLGNLLVPIASETSFASSPMSRTRMTARKIAEGMGICRPQVDEYDVLGNSSFYFTDQRELFEAFQGHDIYPMMERYLQGGPLAGLGDMSVATERLERWIDKHRRGRLSIFVTHDLYTAAFLTVRRVAEFTARRWIGFLEGAAVIDDVRGVRRYAYVRM